MTQRTSALKNDLSVLSLSPPSPPSPLSPLSEGVVNPTQRAPKKNSELNFETISIEVNDRKKMVNIFNREFLKLRILKDVNQTRWNHMIVSPILLYFCTFDLIGLFIRISKS